MQIVKLLIVISILTQLSLADNNISKVEQKKLDKASKVQPLSKTKFWVTRDNGDQYEMDLLGKNFIVVSLREKDADGLIYAVDKDGLVWWAESISSGKMGHETPSSIYPVLFKKAEHASTENPSSSGRNNMDLSLWFTYRGHAIHLGNPNAPSHGCIHVGRRGAQTLFDWANIETKIVITRERYLPFVRSDLAKVGYRASDAPKRIQQYLRDNPVSAPVLKPEVPQAEQNSTNLPSTEQAKDLF